MAALFADTCLVVLISVTLPAIAPGQSLEARATPRANVANPTQSTVLDRPVSLTLKDATLATALRELQRVVGIAITYQTNHVDTITKRISVRCADVPLRVALDSILNGTGLRVRETVTHQVYLERIRNDAHERVSRGTGTVYGTITDAATHDGVEGVNVRFDEGYLGAVTGRDGSYRIATAPEGEHTITARRLGYSAAKRTVVIKAGEDIRLDIELEKSPSILDRIVVTSTVAPTEVRALPTPISVVNSAQIEAQHLTRVDQLFRGPIPGGVSWDQGTLDYTNSITVRGTTSLFAGSNSIKTYIDGIEVTNDVYGTVDAASIGRVEVIRGPQASTIYGTDASGGVMQVFTKTGDPTRARLTLRTQAATTFIESPYQSNHVPEQSYSGNVSGGAEGYTYYLGGAFQRTGAWAPHYFARTPSLFGNLQTTQGRMTIGVVAHYSTKNFALLDPLTTTGIDSLSAPTHEVFETGRQTYGVHLQLTATQQWHHNVVVGFDRYVVGIVQNEPRLRTPSDTLLFLSSEDHQKVSASYNTSYYAPLTRALTATLTAGADHYSANDAGYSERKAVTVTTPIRIDPSSPPSISRGMQTNSGFFGQGQLAYNNAVFLTVGIRGDRNSAFGSGFGTAWSPRVGLSMVRDIGRATVKVRGSYGKGTRAPFPGASAPGPGKAANPLLGPERQNGGDGGVDVYFGSGASLSATYYNQQAIDLIDQVMVDTVDGRPEYQNQNIGKIRNSGYEVEGTLSRGPVSLTAQYSIMNSVVRTLSPNYTGDLQPGDRLLYIPRRSGGVTASFAPLTRTHVTASVFYVGSWTGQDIVALLDGSPWRGSLRAYWMRYPAFAKVNLSLDQSISDRVAAYVSIRNLGNNTAFEQSNVFITQGRATTIGVRVSN
jgi:outer membrane receptor protein involved in Fe transport